LGGTYITLGGEKCIQKLRKFSEKRRPGQPKLIRQNNNKKYLKKPGCGTWQ
jgi:hypothetical protein